MTRTTGPPAPGELVNFPPGGAVLLDRLGAVAIRTEPAGELAILLELGGRLNKQADRQTVAYLLRASQAAEVLAAIAVAVEDLARHGDTAALNFAGELDEAIVREQARLGAVEGEHG